MHSNRYTAAPERKHRNLPRVLAATAAMLCIAALLLVLSVVQSHTAAAVCDWTTLSSSPPAGNAPQAPTLR